MKVWKKISEIKADYLLIGFLILMILPFLILHYFNHPTIEDYFYGEEVKNLGFVKTQRLLYKYWGGRFLTNILICYTPLYFGSIAGYKVLTLLLMLLFSYIIFLLISEITRNSLTFTERFLFSLSIFFLYLYAIPLLPEGFYWLGAVICYNLAIIFILLFIIFYNRLNNTNKSTAWIFYIFISCISIIAIVGSNEFAAALILMLTILLFLKNLFVEKKFRWPLMLFILITGIAIYFSFRSPGSQDRASQYPESHKFFHSIFYSFTFLTQNVLSWIFKSPLLAFTFLLIPIFFKIIKKRGINSDIFSINPVYSLIIWFTFLFACMFIIYWSIGSALYDRKLNFIYFVFLIGWFYNMIVLSSYIYKKSKFNFEKFPKYAYAIAFTIIVLFLFKENNIRNAFYDLSSGIASEYNNELNARYNFLSQSNCDSCEVDKLENFPKTIYVRDIFNDPTLVGNAWYGRYFKKKYVLLKQEKDQKENKKLIKYK